MKVKVKRLHEGRVLRLEARGEIKEVIIDANILNPSGDLVSICFRGDNSSGVIELNEKEAEDLFENLSSKLKLVKSVKVFREKR
jgi:hypothetical protein